MAQPPVSGRNPAESGKQDEKEMEPSPALTVNERDLGSSFLIVPTLSAGFSQETRLRDRVRAKSHDSNYDLAQENAQIVF